MPNVLRIIFIRLLWFFRMLYYFVFHYTIYAYHESKMSFGSLTPTKHILFLQTVISFSSCHQSTVFYDQFSIHRTPVVVSFNVDGFSSFFNSSVGQTSLGDLFLMILVRMTHLLQLAYYVAQ